MQAIELRSDTIPTLNPSDKAAKAADMMAEFRIPALPVVSGSRLVGILKEEAVLNNTDQDATVEKLMDSVELPFVRGKQHIYHVLKLMTERDLAIIPVLDTQGHYLGVVTEHEVVGHMAEVVNASAPGSVVVLEIGRNDYSLQQIARIVEDEGARILNVYCSANPDSMEMEVTLKIDQEDISGILQAFDRYEYTVQSTFQASKLSDNLQERFEGLMRIMKI